MPYTCKECLTERDSPSRLLTHFLISHSSTVIGYPCPQLTCGRTYTTLEACKNHLSRSHVPSTRPKLQCYLCNKEFGDNRETLIDHLKIHIEKNNAAQCPVLRCFLYFTDVDSLRLHISRYHCTWPHLELKKFAANSNLTPVSSTQQFVESSQQNAIMTQGDCTSGGNTNVEPNSIQHTLETNEEKSQIVEKELAKFALSLEPDLHLTVSATNKIVQTLPELFHLNMSLKEKKILDILDRMPQTEETKEIKGVLSDKYTPLEKCFGPSGSLSTDYKRTKYLQDFHSETFVTPLEYELLGDDGNKYSSMYTSLLKTLSALMTHDDIIEDFITEHRKKHGVYSSYRDSTDYEKHALFIKELLAFLLNIYGDEVNMTDPLAIYRNKHKMCGIYFTLLNLSPQHRSQLQSIQPLLLFDHAILKHVKLSDVLAPLLEDIRVLETDGIFIPKLGRIIKGAVAFVSGDNLSSNNFAGIVANFAAESTQSCRGCDIKRCDVHNGLGNCNLRTDTYEQDLAALSAEVKNSNGVVAPCAFSTLNYFSVADCFPWDGMHDLNEGDVPFEVALVLTSMLQEKLFSSAAEIVNKIHSFPYVAKDNQNKPIISSEFRKKKNVGGNASTNWTLIRLLPIIFYNEIPEDFKPWELLMMLKDIVEICLSPCITHDMVQELKVLVAMHRKMFHTLYPEIMMRMKQHHLDHYPKAIVKSGPPIEYWCMRHEAKHSYFKTELERAHNFNNPFKCVAWKHSKYMDHLLNSVHFFSTNEYSQTVLLMLPELEDLLKAAVVAISPSINCVKTFKFAELCGTRYENEGIIVLNHNSTETIFGKIENILMIDNEEYFWCKKYEGLFVLDYRVYELIETEDFTLMAHKNLQNYYPLSHYNENPPIVSLKHALV